MARKAVCTLGHGPHAALLDVSRPTFVDYADRHDYELVTGGVLDHSRPPAWSKIRLLQKALAEFELVVWIDADAVVVDPTQDIADALPPDRVLGIVRHRYQGHVTPNSGVMVMRRDPAMLQFLDDVWAATRFLHHPWWENAAIADALGHSLPGSLDPGSRGGAHRLAKRVLGRELRPARPVRSPPFAARTEYLSNEWNSIFFDQAKHPRIVHCLGTPVEQRLRDMSTTLNAIRPASG